MALENRDRKALGENISSLKLKKKELNEKFQMKKDAGETQFVAWKIIQDRLIRDKIKELRDEMSGLAGVGNQEGNTTEGDGVSTNSRLKGPETQAPLDPLDPQLERLKRLERLERLKESTETQVSQGPPPSYGVARYLDHLSKELTPETQVSQDPPSYEVAQYHAWLSSNEPTPTSQSGGESEPKPVVKSKSKSRRFGCYGGGRVGIRSMKKKNKKKQTNRRKKNKQSKRYKKIK